MTAMGPIQDDWINSALLDNATSNSVTAASVQGRMFATAKSCILETDFHVRPRRAMNFVYFLGL
jgi:hypothetical protein